MLKFGNVEFRNATEQIQKNKDDIAQLQKLIDYNEDFPLNVKGIYTSISSIDFTPEENDMVLIGSSEPYDLYLYAVKSGTEQWVKLGQYPAVGPQGVPGQDGEDGRGITSITKTATEGLVDTYTIEYSNGTFSTFTVTNGQDGESPVLEWGNIEGTLSDQEDLQDALDEKVDRVTARPASFSTVSLGVYGERYVGSAATPVMTEVSNTAKGSTIVLRDASGNVRTGTPSIPSDAVNVQYAQDNFMVLDSSTNSNEYFPIKNVVNSSTGHKTGLSLNPTTLVLSDNDSGALSFNLDTATLEHFDDGDTKFTVTTHRKDNTGHSPTVDLKSGNASEINLTADAINLDGDVSIDGDMDLIGDVSLAGDASVTGTVNINNMTISPSGLLTSLFTITPVTVNED